MPSRPGPLRSMLFTPGNHARRVEKALTLSVDAIILDLEDAVAISQKPIARATVVQMVSRPRQSGPLVYVRVNASDTEWHDEDLTEVIGSGIDGVVLPKAEHPERVADVHAKISDLEVSQNLVPGKIDLLPIIETGKGMAAVRAIAGSNPRTSCLSFGAADFAVDMGMRWTRDEAEMTPARAEIALACRAASLAAPVDTVWTRLDDEEGLARSAQRVRDLGFQGKFCIHPDQIEPVQAAFTPTDDEIAQAQKIVAAFETAEREGAASINVDGHFVDYPIVERARRMLAFLTELQN